MCTVQELNNLLSVVSLYVLRNVMYTVDNDVLTCMHVQKSGPNSTLTYSGIII